MAGIGSAFCHTLLRCIDRPMHEYRQPCESAVDHFGLLMNFSGSFTSWDASRGTQETITSARAGSRFEPVLSAGLAFGAWLMAAMAHFGHARCMR